MHSSPMTSSPMAPRTRVFAALIKLALHEPEDGSEMLELRERRQRLLETSAGRAVFGATSPDVEVRNLLVTTEAGRQRMLVHLPRHRSTDPLPMVVNYHGGGWCLGSPEQSRWLASRVAAEVGAVVVSPTYRLAPEHEYPAAVDDAWASLRWIHAHAEELGGDADRLAVMGDSAGGNQAAVMTLQARDAGGPPLRAQVLIYPAVEMYERWPSEDEYDQAPVLTSELMHRFAHLYLGPSYGTEDWRVSPIRATDHSGLPPALILTAGHDPIRDHGPKYTEVLHAAGVEATLINYPQAIHGFASLPGVVPAAADLRDDVIEFLREQLLTD